MNSKSLKSVFVVLGLTSVILQPSLALARPIAELSMIASDEIRERSYQCEINNDSIQGTVNGSFSEPHFMQDEDGTCMVHAEVTWSCNCTAEVVPTSKDWCDYPLVPEPLPTCAEGTSFGGSYDGSSEFNPAFPPQSVGKFVSCSISTTEILALLQELVGDLQEDCQGESCAFFNWCQQSCADAFDQVDIDGDDESYEWDNYHDNDTGLGYGTFECSSSFCPNPHADVSFDRQCPDFALRFGNPPQRGPNTNLTGYTDEQWDACFAAWHLMSFDAQGVCYQAEASDPSPEGELEVNTIRIRR
ncbi:MAG: hypothetical protein KDD62_08785 [Bdellovibrionales bacterium]|nr:hypothetical protein [Bdellovibrionales bacterium]